MENIKQHLNNNFKCLNDMHSGLSWYDSSYYYSLSILLELARIAGYY